MPFESLPGFREFYPDACSLRNYIFNVWRNTARSFNFLEYDAPVLEPLEIYVEKSGEEIVNQLFSFEDRGGRAVALRPEMTPSLARMVGARANSLKRPLKWYNIGEHYRYERPQKGRLRAFYQFNADILGEAGTAADSEIILMLIQVLRSFGLESKDFNVRLSDRCLWLIFLKAEGLGDSAIITVMGIIDKLGRTSRDKALESLMAMIGNAANNLLDRIEHVMTLNSYEAVSSFMLGCSMDCELEEQCRARLNDWDALLKQLNGAGVGDFIKIEFSVVRGLAYYSGFVFEAFEASGDGRALAGGGRYDGLVKKMGGPDISSVGFAMGDVTLLDLLEIKELLPTIVQKPDFYIIIGGPDERLIAIKDAVWLRSHGYRVDYSLKDSGLSKQFKEANHKGARYALIYGFEEVESGTVRVRDFVKGNELLVPRSEFYKSIQEIMEFGIA